MQDTSLRAGQEDEEEGEEERVLELDQNTNGPGFIRIRVSSRFRNAVQHQLWIAFNEEYYCNNFDVDNREDPIIGYYCTCKTGARTLGTCTHVASILWYMGYARHEQNVRYPSLNVLRSVCDVTMDIDQIEIIDPFLAND
ncbi:hypothetical protein RF55_13772 [Lasius niger]|uniref:SWIM-type domain-containing protein n=1 Tax=Lasius niger TaxID=67767 RepID=A0A0J7K9Y4_LASNI|nr:hypothetical protein RF55_13772 [Lasius niger]